MPWIFKVLILFTLVGYGTSAVLKADDILPYYDTKDGEDTLVLTIDNVADVPLEVVVEYYLQPMRVRFGVRDWIIINDELMHATAGTCVIQAIDGMFVSDIPTIDFFLCMEYNLYLYAGEVYDAIDQQGKRLRTVPPSAGSKVI